MAALDHYQIFSHVFPILNHSFECMRVHFWISLQFSIAIAFAKWFSKQQFDYTFFPWIFELMLNLRYRCNFCNSQMMAFQCCIAFHGERSYFASIFTLSWWDRVRDTINNLFVKITVFPLWNIAIDISMS